MISSTDPAAPPYWVTTDRVRIFGYAMQYGVSSSGIVSGAMGSTLIYQTYGDVRGDHIWALDLSPNSTLVPQQLSSEALDRTCQYSGRVVQKDLKDPDTAFLFLEMPDLVPCSSVSPGTTHIGLIRLSGGGDSPASAVPVRAAGFLELETLYDPSGVLTGLVAVDAANNLNFYSDETFANFRTLLPGINFFASRSVTASSPLSDVSTHPSYEFIVTTPHSPTTPSSLYRLDYSGAISAHLYDFHTELLALAEDDANLYFRDVEQVSQTTDATADHVVRVPLDGATSASVIHTYNNPGPGVPNLDLIGSTGSTLFVERFGSVDPASGNPVSTVESIPLATPSVSTVLTTESNYGFPAQLLGSHIFLTFARGDSSSGTYTSVESTKVLSLDGMLAEPLLDHSAFLSDGVSMFQVIHTTSGNIGGGALTVLVNDIASSQPWTTITNADGTPFFYPTDQYDVFGAFNSLSSTVDVGLALVSTGNLGLILNPATKTIYPVAMPKTDLRFPTAGLFNITFGSP